MGQTRVPGALGQSLSAGRAGACQVRCRVPRGQTRVPVVAFGFKLLDQVAADLRWVSACVLGRAHVES